MDWFPWYPALYRADTLDLTLEQDGAYRRLIDHYMETRLPLPDNDNSLARIVGISINDFQAIAEQVRSKFNATAGELHSKRCDIELNRQDSLSKKRSEVAKAAHTKRNKNNGVQAIAKQKQSNSTDTGQDKTGQTGEDKEKKELCAFDDFWLQCPVKKSKKKARALYDGVIKRGEATHAVLLEGIMKYAMSDEVQRGYAKHPTTWLNGGCWDDEPTPARKQQSAVMEAVRGLQS